MKIKIYYNIVIVFNPKTLFKLERVLIQFLFNTLDRIYISLFLTIILY